MGGMSAIAAAAKSVMTGVAGVAGSKLASSGAAKVATKAANVASNSNSLQKLADGAIDTGKEIIGKHPLSQAYNAAQNGNWKEAGSNIAKAGLAGSNKEIPKSNVPKSSSPFIQAQIDPGMGQAQEQGVNIQKPTPPPKAVNFNDSLSEAFSRIM